MKCPIGLFSCVQLWLDLPCKIFVAPIGGPVQAHFLAVVYGTVIVFPNAVLGTDGADGGVGGVIPMLAEGAAVVGADVDGAFHKNLLKIGALLNLLYIYATMKEKVHDICC